MERSGTGRVAALFGYLVPSSAVPATTPIVGV